MMSELGLFLLSPGKSPGGFDAEAPYDSLMISNTLFIRVNSRICWTGGEGLRKRIAPG